MGDIIRVKNTSYGRYEELLVKRDDLRKQAFQARQGYIREFGELILEVYQMKIDCIKKKKIIEFYQAALNRGGMVDQNELEAYLQREMKEYQEQVDQMVKENEDAQSTGTVTQMEVLKIKRIYRKLAKLIHPDINPMVNDSEELMDLWNRVVIAYNCNQLVDIEELEVLVHKALEQLGVDGLELEIPNIEQRILELQEEIHKIETTDPYMYRFLLDDKAAVREKKEALKSELEEYRNYARDLDGIIDQLMTGGVSIIWRTN